MKPDPTLYCFYCGKLATKLCDGRAESGTCDRAMCDGCVSHSFPYFACARGRGSRKYSHAGTRDYCRECAQNRAKEAHHAAT